METFRMEDPIQTMKCDDNCDIFQEPTGCITLPSLKDEVQEFKDEKPVDIFLKHCKEFSEKNLKELKIKLSNYQFKQTDFTSKIMSQYLESHVKLGDVPENESEQSYDFEAQGNNVNVETPFQERKMRIFMDYIYVGGHIHFVVKTWRKFGFNPNQNDELEGTDQLFSNLNKTGNQAGLKDYLNNQSASIDSMNLQSKGASSMLNKTGALLKKSLNNRRNMMKLGRRFNFQDQYEDEQTFFIKTMAIYDHELNLKKEILVEQLRQIKNKRKEKSTEDVTYEQSHNISTIQHENKLYYWKRVYDDRHADEERQTTKLQLYSYDIIQNQEASVSEYFIDETWNGMNNTDRSNAGSSDRQQVAINDREVQFQVNFSQRIDSSGTQKEREFEDEKEFLNSQFFVIQQYTNENMNIVEKNQMLNMYEIRAMDDCEMGIKMNKKSDNDQERQSHPYHTIYHIENFSQDGSHIDKDTTYFLLVDSNQMTEIQLTKQDQYQQLTLVKDEHLRMFKNQNDVFMHPTTPIRPQQIQLDSYNEKDKAIQINQFYYVDSKNKVQLLFPNYYGKVQQNKIIELIQTQANIQVKSPQTFKRIQKYSDQCKNVCNVFQEFKHLQKLLNYKDSPDNYQEVQESEEFNYGEDHDHQFLTILDPFSDGQTFIRVITLKQHHCKKCLDSESLMNKQNQTVMKQQSQVLLRGVTNTLKSLFNKKEMEQHAKFCKDQEHDHLKITQEHNNDFVMQQLKENLAVLCGDQNTKPFIKMQMKPNNNLMAAKKEDRELEKYQQLDSMNFIRLQDFQGTQVNVKIHERVAYSTVKQDLNLLFSCIMVWYQKMKHKTVFFFAVSNTVENITKRSYIIVIKTNKDMLDIFDSNGTKCIIGLNDYVTVIKDLDSVDIMRLKEVEEWQFNAHDPQMDGYSLREGNKKMAPNAKFRDIKLTFPNFSDDLVQCNFIPMIYQENYTVLNNRLLVYDIVVENFTEQHQINPTLVNQKLMYTDKMGFNCYSFCRISQIKVDDVVGKDSQPTYQCAKYSLFTIFKEKLGRIQIQDFVISHDKKIKEQPIDVQMIGQKQILLSNEFIQKSNFDYLKNSQAISFYDDCGAIKGCQFILQKTKEEDYSVINLLDQDKNNIYTYLTEVVCLGSKKYDLDKKDSSQYAMVISAQLRTQFIQQRTFENHEAYMVLRKATDKMLGMKLPDLNYIIMNNFEDMKNRDFFQSQELLRGKSICEISLNDPYSIQVAVEKWETFSPICTGSIINKISKGDNVRRTTFEEVGFYQPVLMLQRDLNFGGTIERALSQNSIKALMVILHFIMDHLNTPKYREFIMHDLPAILKSNKLAINDFFSRLSGEQRIKYGNIGCNMESEFSDIQLPVFSEKQTEYILAKNFLNSHNVQEELADKIIERDQEKDADLQKNFEVEHTFIDFREMIIGAKIKSTLEGEEPYVLNHTELSDMMCRDDENMSFYMQDTIQRIIEYQWITTKRIQQTLFSIYILMFIFPFIIMLLSPENKDLHPTLLKIGCFPQYILFSIEITQIKAQGLAYFAGWNLSDFIGFLLFQWLVIINIYYSDTEQASFGYIPELKLLIVIMSFMKVLFFVRIFESYGFLVQMIKFCIIDLIPFIICFITFLFVFSICFVVLDMEIDPEVVEAEGITFFQKTILQTFRTSIGELGMPVYTKILVQDDGFWKNLNIFLIWMIWYMQSFFMLVVMLNFIIAVITSTYDRVIGLQKIISLKHKADLNQECNELLSLFGFNEEFKLIVFSNSKETTGLEEDQLAEVVVQVRRFIQRENKDLKISHAELSKTLTMVREDQNDLQEAIDNRFDELQQKQENIKESILKEIKSKLG